MSPCAARVWRCPTRRTRAPPRSAVQRRHLVRDRLRGEGVHDVGRVLPHGVAPGRGEGEGRAGQRSTRPRAPRSPRLLTPHAVRPPTTPTAPPPPAFAAVGAFDRQPRGAAASLPGRGRVRERRRRDLVDVPLPRAADGRPRGQGHGPPVCVASPRQVGGPRSRIERPAAPPNPSHPSQISAGRRVPSTTSRCEAGRGVAHSSP